jgi:hypothetical protein
MGNPLILLTDYKGRTTIPDLRHHFLPAYQMQKKKKKKKKQEGIVKSSAIQISRTAHFERQ